MPTWILGPDPNKQCCGCAAKSGPCDNCCPVNTYDPIYRYDSLDFPSGTIIFDNRTNATVSKIGINGISVSTPGPVSPLIGDPNIAFNLTVKNNYYVKIVAKTATNQYNSGNAIGCGINNIYNTKYVASTSFTFGSGYSGIFTNLPSVYHNTHGYNQIHSLDALCSEIGEYDYTITDINGVTTSTGPRHTYDMLLYSNYTYLDSLLQATKQVLSATVYSYGQLEYASNGCPYTIGNNNFCGQNNLAGGCIQAGCTPPRDYTVTPTQQTAVDAPSVSLTQTSQITNAQFVGSGVSGLCSYATLAGNCEFYLYDESMNPINITGLLIRFNFTSLP